MFTNIIEKGLANKGFEGCTLTITNDGVSMKKVTFTGVPNMEKLIAFLANDDWVENLLIMYEAGAKVTIAQNPNFLDGDFKGMMAVVSDLPLGLSPQEVDLFNLWVEMVELYAQQTAVKLSILLHQLSKATPGYRRHIDFTSSAGLSLHVYADEPKGDPLAAWDEPFQDYLVEEMVSGRLQCLTLECELRDGDNVLFKKRSEGIFTSVDAEEKGFWGEVESLKRATMNYTGHALAGDPIAVQYESCAPH